MQIKVEEVFQEGLYDKMDHWDVDFSQMGGKFWF